MSEKIVSKFGGTSNADAAAVAQCMELAGDSTILVTSAPGKLTSAQLEAFPEIPGIPHEFIGKKITDQLLTAHKTSSPTGETPGEIPAYMTDSITARYAHIVRGLGIRSLDGDWLKAITPRVVSSVQHGEDYASMLGEQLQSEVYRALGWTLLDPARADIPLLPRQKAAWRQWLQPIVEIGEHYVIPGNIYTDGQRAYTYSRGGSDITGADASFAIEADVYRNMTDTPAQSVWSHYIADDSRRRNLRHLTYMEGRELGRNGTGLLHPEAIIPLMGTGIPTEIRNTFDPTGAYTLYTDDVDDERRTGQVMAISVVPEASLVTVHEPGMSETKGRIAHLSGVVAAAGVSVIDIVGHGSDTELFIVESKDTDKVHEQLRTTVNGQGTVTAEDCAMVTLVGYNLARRALDIRFELALNAGLGKQYLFSDPVPHWMEGTHSLRFTLNRDAVTQVVDDAHRVLIETHIAQN